MNMMMILGLTSVLLLALVAGLLVAVGLELRRLKPALRGAPLLAEQLTAQVLSVKQLLGQVKQGVSAVGPQVAEAEKLRQDLQYLCARAEQLAQRLEVEPASQKGPVRGALEEQMRVAVEAQVAEIELTVGRSNGVAARQPESVTRDPLEELLAGLEAVAPEHTPVKSRVRKSAAQPTLPVVV